MSRPRLLIVDDEATLRGLLRRYLERAGYEVVAFASSEEALAAFSADPRGFALVITDLTLDSMNGEEMLEQMRARNPQIPAFIASGYPYVPRLEGVGFLQKPFLPKMLTEAVERALEG